jgi:hypothetical protein
MKVKSIAYEGRYIHPTDAATSTDALHALGTSTKPELIAHTLDIITPGVKSYAQADTASTTTSKRSSPLVINRRDRLGIFKSLSQHAAGSQASWDWLRRNWDTLSRYYGDGSLGGFTFITSVLAGLASPAHLNEVQAFFSDKTKEVSAMMFIIFWVSQANRSSSPLSFSLLRVSIPLEVGLDLWKPTETSYDSGPRTTGLFQDRLRSQKTRTKQKSYTHSRWTRALEQ